MNLIINALLPKKIISASMRRLALIEQPMLKNFFIRVFMKITGANLNDAERKSIDDYNSLLDFFTRELASGERHIEGKDDLNVIISPVDGRVVHAGSIYKEQIFQIKGHTYSLNELVGNDYANLYEDGQSATIYLAPFNYHRVHMPMKGKLLRARYLPGNLNSVSVDLLDRVSGLFAKNERVVLEFVGDDLQPFLIVLVGAVGVGSIVTVFHGEICPNHKNTPIDLTCYDQELDKGEELGRFNLGSTVIFITPKNNHTWQLQDNQKICMGENIAKLKVKK